VYEPTTGQLAREELILGAVFSGRRSEPNWRAGDEQWDFFAAKGILEALAASLELSGFDYAPVGGMPFHPTRAASVSLGEKVIGAIGELHPGVCERFSITEQSIALEIALAPVFAAIPGRAKVEELSRYPGIYIDVAVVVEEGVAARRVEDIIRGAGQPELQSVRLFDVYRGSQIEVGRKSLAFALELRSHERTLTDDDAALIVDRVLTALEERTGARLRT
jgi:phenylalanyl-tRNA synthetase beta chain